MKLQVLACDIDQKFPAKTYTITASDGRSISKDLCEEHAEPFEEWLEEAEVGKEAVVDEQPEAPPVVPRRGVSKKVAPKKAPAKKATAPRRRMNVTSFEEIEKSKQQG